MIARLKKIEKEVNKIDHVKGPDMARGCAIIPEK